MMNREMISSKQGSGKTLGSQSKHLLDLHNQLISSGVKQKEIARRIGLYPSAYSTMAHRVLPRLVPFSDSRPSTQQISQVFSAVNNVSESRLRQNIHHYIEELTSMSRELDGQQRRKQERYIDQLIAASPIHLLQKLQGIYDCCYFSSFGYRVKREPLMIKYSSTRECIEVTKGNRLSPAIYQGFGYVSNNHLLTLQMQEQGTMIPDNTILHLHLPPIYPDSLSMLKGISVSMSNACMPISRKVILHKISSLGSADEYDDIETHFYPAGEGDDESIVKYLREERSYIEYVPIPHPQYDLTDLEKEQRVAKLSREG